MELIRLIAIGVALFLALEIIAVDRSWRSYLWRSVAVVVIVALMWAGG